MSTPQGRMTPDMAARWDAALALLAAEQRELHAICAWIKGE